MAVGPADTEASLRINMKMGGRQVETREPSCISEHHSLYKISSMKAKKYEDSPYSQKSLYTLHSALHKLGLTSVDSKTMGHVIVCIC